jgi:hypothetical protein
VRVWDAILRLAERLVAVVLAATFSATLPLPLPSDGLSDTHVAALPADQTHPVPVVTSIVADPPDAANDRLLAVTE